MHQQLQSQGGTIVESLATAGIESTWDTEIVAMIAYLPRLGVDGRREFQRREAEGSAESAQGAGR